MSDPGNTLDPHIARMRGAEGDTQRAAVLLEAPVFTLIRWLPVFMELCRRAAFHEGVAYLDALCETLGKERHRGNLSGTMGMAGATATLLHLVDMGGA